MPKTSASAAQDAITKLRVFPRTSNTSLAALDVSLAHARTCLAELRDVPSIPDMSVALLVVDRLLRTAQVQLKSFVGKETQRHA